MEVSVICFYLQLLSQGKKTRSADYVFLSLADVVVNSSGSVNNVKEKPVWTSMKPV